ncbi:MAG TPA: hypothetical protein EYO00_06965 [Gammaproteobacteria bacterium]|jgi:hypothetical protein|nr:hypothetical protein [Gammaproteobacteria bacterium]HIN89165.1 hypothetical protein [Porticoccaceae bacterium]
MTARYDHYLYNSLLELGEYNLIVERQFQHTTRIDAAAEISTEVEPGAVRVDLALTITDNAEVKEEHHPLEQTLIGIDLGEAGIGYSVFEVSDVAKGAEAMTPVLSGSIPIRSIRNLIRAVKVHRIIPQLLQ